MDKVLHTMSFDPSKTFDFYDVVFDMYNAQVQRQVLGHRMPKSRHDSCRVVFWYGRAASLHRCGAVLLPCQADSRGGECEV